MKNYDKYLPQKVKTRLVQGKVREDIHERAKAILEKEGWTWHEVVEGLLNKFVVEYKAKK